MVDQTKLQTFVSALDPLIDQMGGSQVIELVRQLVDAKVLNSQPASFGNRIPFLDSKKRSTKIKTNFKPGKWNIMPSELVREGEERSDDAHT